MSNLRKLKVYAKFSKRSSFEQVATPQINLHGLWLKTAGFEMGKQIFVKVENGRLIIDSERRAQNG